MSDSITSGWCCKVFRWYLRLRQQMPLQRCVWFFQNNQIFWTSPSECTCAKLVNALSSASESPFHLKFHSSYYQWYQSTRTRRSPRFCIKIEKTCNEIGVAANNMTLNTGHPAMVFIFESCILLMPFSAVKIRKDGRSANIQ